MKHMEEKKLWFKAKTYGWGWTPASWQGWLTLGLYLVVTLSLTFSLAPTDSGMIESASEAMVFFGAVIIPTAILLVICFLTGEKPRWRWGKEKE